MFETGQTYEFIINLMFDRVNKFKLPSAASSRLLHLLNLIKLLFIKS